MIDDALPYRRIVSAMLLRTVRDAERGDDDATFDGRAAWAA